MKALNILLVVSTLNQGGIERQLTMLAPGLIKRGHHVTIVVFHAGGFYEEVLRANGVDIVALSDRPYIPHSSALRRMMVALKRITKTARLGYREQFDVAYGFGVTSNMLSSIIGAVSGAKVVWGIRNSLPQGGRIQSILERLGSRFVNLIICNSEAGRQMVIAKRLHVRCITKIPNGIDTKRNRIERKWRSEARAEFNVSDCEFLIGTVGRLDQYKDQRTFLTSARAVFTECSQARFMIVGRGSEEYTSELKEYALQLGIADEIIWTGARSDVEKCLNAMDVFVSTSQTEGFPNVIAEAMSIGLPCIVTPAGESSDIVADLGTVVDFKDVSEFATAILQVMREHKSVNHAAIRKRIEQDYSPESMVNRTDIALQGLFK